SATRASARSRPPSRSTFVMYFRSYQRAQVAKRPALARPSLTKFAAASRDHGTARRWAAPSLRLQSPILCRLSVALLNRHEHRQRGLDFLVGDNQFGLAVEMIRHPPYPAGLHAIVEVRRVLMGLRAFHDA